MIRIIVSGLIGAIIGAVGTYAWIMWAVSRGV